MRTAKAIVQDILEFPGVIALSDILALPKVDIDLYVSSAEQIDRAVHLLSHEGFVITARGLTHAVAFRFEGGELFMVDLLSDFNSFAEALPFLQLSAEGQKTIVKSPEVHDVFKSLCLNRKENAYKADRNKEAWTAFLQNEAHFKYPSKFRRSLIGLCGNALFRRTSLISWPRKLMASVRYRFGRMGKGVSLAFVGPDGSGKSFIIEKIRRIGPASVVYMGDWFFTLQPFYTFVVKRIPSPWNRFLYIFYFIENLGRAVKVAILRFLGRIVLIDRFPGTNRNIVRGGVLLKINQALFRFFPKPDEIVFLYADPEVIYQRKKELSVDEIRLLQEKLDKMLSKTSHRKLNTAKLDESLNAIMSAAYAKTGML